MKLKKYCKIINKLCLKGAFADIYNPLQGAASAYVKMSIYILYYFFIQMSNVFIKKLQIIFIYSILPKICGQI